jgi:hypothetical protein
MHGDGTVKGYAISLDLFVRFLREREGARASLELGLLSKAVTAEFYDWLKSHGRHGRVPGLETRRKRIQHVEAAWAWAREQDEFADFVPNLRRLDMPKAPRTPTLAPTWEEMDACIAATNLPWLRRLLIVLRFTGLRVQQGMGLL